MDYLPIFLDVRGKKVLVDGGGTAAARRIERALSAGADVSAFDPSPEEEVRRLLGRAGLSFHDRLPAQADVAGCAVVYGASEDETRDADLYAWAQAEGALCNIADVKEKCDFITPSIVDRSPIVVAISTGGAAPVIARTLRARIEANLPPAFGALTEFVGGFRDRIAATIPEGRDRRHFWERLIDGRVADLFLGGDESAANAQFDKDIAGVKAGAPVSRGEVYLVGAGPGNPDLLTFRALRLMQRADVVLYDRLIGDEIMTLVRRDAERIYVGKLPKQHTMAQEDISALMVRLAKEGNRVLRLKGGDPFIFGRGGEEIETLSASGVPFQVVPGITAASGCGAYAGIPLTHRDHAQSVVFATAHGKDGVLDLDWKMLIRPSQTVAIYMGLSSLPTMVEGFEKHGVSLSTPVAIVQNGTTAAQQVVVGTLADIAGKVEQAGMVSPAMIIIGSVVTLRDKLAWHGSDGTRHEMGLSASTTQAV